MKKIPLLLLIITYFVIISPSNAQETYKTLKKTTKELVNAGKYVEALPFAEQTVSATLKELGKNDPQYMLAQLKLGDILRILGKYPQAETLYLNMSEQDKQQYGDTSTVYARGLESLVIVYSLQGKYALAEKTQEISYKIILKNTGNQSEFFAQSLNNMASVKQQMGKLVEANTFYLQSIDLEQKLNLQNTTKHAKTLKNYALNLYQMGKYQESTTILKDALRIVKQAETENSLTYANILHYLGNNYVALSKYTDAETSYNQALAIQKAVFSENTSDYANTLGALGELYKKKTDFVKSETFLLQSSQIRKKVLGENSYEYASSLSQIANLYQKTSRLREAEVLKKKAMSIFKGIVGETHPDYVRSMIEYAEICVILSWFDTAEPYLLKGKALYTDIYGANAIQMPPLYTNFVDLYLQTSRFTPAVEYAQKAWTIDKAILGENNAEFATTTMNLGRTLMYAGRYDESEKYLLQSLSIRTKLFNENHFTCGYSYQNLAELYSRMSLNKEAIQNAKKAYTIFEKTLGKTSIEYAVACNFLGEQSTFKTDFVEAMTKFEESLSIVEKVLGKEHPLYMLVLQNLTSIYLKTGKTKEGMLLYNKLQTYYMTDKGEKDPNIASFTMMMAFMHANAGNKEMSEKLMNISAGMYLKKFGSNNLETNLAIAYNVLLYMNNGKFTPDVRKTYQIFKENQQIFTDKFFPHFTEQERDAFFKNSALLFEKFCTPLLKNGTSEDINLVFDTQLFTKSMLFTASNKTKKAILESKDATIIALYEKYQAQKEKNLRYLKLSVDDLKAQNINLDSLENNISQLEKQLAQKTKKFVVDSKNITHKDIQKKLKANEVAIEVIRYREMKEFGIVNDSLIHYAVLILREKGDTEVVLIKNGNELEQESVYFYKNNIFAKKIDKFSYNNFWKNIAQKLVGVKKVYFSPDGVYNQLSLDALYNPTTEKYLSDEIDIQLVVSTRDILELNEVQQKENFANFQAYLVGFPAYGTKKMTSNTKNNTSDRGIKTNTINQQTKQTLSRAMNFADVKDLPGTKTEIDNLGTIITQANIKTTIFTQEKATEDAIKAFKKPSILHIATHGFFISNEKDNLSNAFFDGLSDDALKKVVSNPLLRSGLLLAGCKQSILEKNTDNNTSTIIQEDGILTAYEVTNLDLENTSLVVLSACETGLGDVVNGEGVFGLQRAIKVAGAKSIIMSLWKVDDAASQEFMTAFYTNWITKKLSKRDAFRGAQTTIRQKYASPIYWAAFVLVGE